MRARALPSLVVLSNRALMAHGVIGLFVLLSPTAARGCTLCIGMPAKTHADLLAQGDCVILASCDANDPFTYSPCETLKGDDEGQKIDLLVDSRSRRVLQANPELRAVLVREASEGPWRCLGIASKAYETVVRRIVACSPEWQGPIGASRRVQFFLPLFGHGDPNIRELAYLELGRAPYSTIRQLGRVASRDTYLPMLTEPRYLEWRSLAILLLAQSEAPEDKEWILDSFHSAERFGIIRHLAAWTAAAIEVEGESMVRAIENQYFRRPNVDPEILQALWRALSMHGSQPNADLQDRIVESYGTLLEYAPDFAPQVADDLYAWKRWDLTGVLATILKNNQALNVADRRSIQRYLRAATSGKELTIVRD